MLTYDPRYEQNGLHTNQWELQSQSNVYNHLMVSPSYFGTGPIEGNLKDFKVSGWNRPTLNWSLECEAEGKYREEGY